MVISFPLYLLLIPYGIVLLLFVFTAFFNVYNLVRLEATNNTSFLATFFFFAGAAVVLFLTWQELKGIDWKMPVQVGTPARQLAPSNDFL